MGPVDGSAEPSELIYGTHAIREALRSGSRPLLRLVIAGHDRRLSDVLELAKQLRVPIHIEPRHALDRLVPGGRHQGIIGLIAAKPYAETEEVLDAARHRREQPFVVILDGVEDPQNLGAIARSAEGAGVHGIFIPERRAAGLTAAVAKASAGAIEYLRVGRVTNLSRLIEILQKEGLWVYGLDPTAEKSYLDLDFCGPVAVVLGGESKGLRPGVLGKCDDRACIPMRGSVASLNVSAAAAVVLFEAVRQRTARRISGSESSRPESRL
jgi:23S rRNA (guanosine2251-2'-O)-methyltransferase